MKLGSIKIDSVKASAGAWVSDIAGLPGVALKVRGFGSPAYQDLQARLYDEIPLVERFGGVSPERRFAIETRCLAEVILVDWSGLEDEDGNPLPFDKDFAERTLADPDFAFFRAAVRAAAQVQGELGTAALKADLGN